MQIRYHLNSLFLVALLGAATAAEAQVTPELAKRYFEEAQKLCERDAGRLWGISLCGPLVIYDPASGTRAPNQPEPAGAGPRNKPRARWPWGPTPAACFPARRTTNGATRFAKGLLTTPASPSGPI